MASAGKMALKATVMMEADLVVVVALVLKELTEVLEVVIMVVSPMEIAMAAIVHPSVASEA